MKNVEIDYSDDVLDTRDLNARIDELASIRDAHEDWFQSKRNAVSSEEVDELEANEPEEYTVEMEKELSALMEAKSEIPEWRHGETLINENYWMDYCREMVADIGDLPSNLPIYIENNIDWQGVANDLSDDYNTIDLMGETFYYRR